MEFTIDELTALVLQHGRMAMQLRKAAAEHDKVAQIYLEAGKRIRREEEEQESKMNIRKIISGISVLMLIVVVFGFALSSQTRTLAQDVPAATVEATVNGQPVEATLIAPALTPVPEQSPTPADNGTAIVHEIGQELVILVLIVGLVLLAFKCAGLVPKETFDSALSKGFGILTGLADRSPTPIDNTLLETFGPMLLTWLDKELDKRQGIAIVPIPP
nr:hypothetical protein [Anaerolineae bacterium]